jgi:hypothetical protein
MNRVYEIELSEESLKKFSSTLEKIESKISGEDFSRFLLKKCNDLLSKIMERENIGEEQRVFDYLAGNKNNIGKDFVQLYNDSEIDIASQDTWFNDYGKQFYPSKLSLAELVEYGTGVIGSLYSRNTGDEWEYEVNPNRDYDKGWEWNNASYPSSESPTLGQAGKYIYFQLQEEAREHIEEWVVEYIDSLIGGSV